MKSRKDASCIGSVCNPKPHSMLGAGALASTVWKTTEQGERDPFRFNVFRLEADNGNVTQRFASSDIPDLARLTQVLAIALSGEEGLGDELRDDLACLAACLGDVLPSIRPVARPAPRTGVHQALRKVVEYLLDDEQRHFRDQPDTGHVYRSVVLVARWLEGSAKDEDELAEVGNLAGLDYFGTCPICARNDGHLNVGRAQWFVCHEHQVRWCAGENLFSTCRHESEADWQRNWTHIGGYLVVQPLRPRESATAEP